MEVIARGLRYADEPPRKIDAVWIDTSDAAISSRRRVSFRLLRLRRKLVLHDSCGGAGAFRSGRYRQRAGVATESAGATSAGRRRSTEDGGTGLRGGNVDGGKQGTVPRAAAGEAGHGDLHRADYF